ncbi:DUF881 domain-containing protein [Pontibacillus yanchengensis]|uniref:NgoFVII family restriction endonuclease n=1 Tax=Pontibacillus yanchengensis Y32 TaxID=1385514 RepID=A0A0A2TEB9_9BACI|nr:DUF881 domain-containing protein [Pontibacillus yanchengensis]KGP72426.1 hypothetical protein N782_05845 [Pontibacillus yanchengensis Y32]
MKLRSKIIFSFIFALVGFMVAIQFQSNQIPEERDTRDLWEVRTDLQEQQKIQQQLYSRISELDEMIQQYEGQSQTEKVATLKQSIIELRKKAGLTEVEGDGIRITVKPIFQELNSSQTYPTISPSLLQRLINELNTYGATDIAIGNERITNISPIRDVNGNTYVNNHPIPPLPVEIKVLTQSPKRLLDYMQVSKSKDEFAIENLELSITAEDEMSLPKFEQMPRLNYLEVDENAETGEQ